MSEGEREVVYRAGCNKLNKGELGHDLTYALSASGTPLFLKDYVIPF